MSKKNDILKNLLIKKLPLKYITNIKNWSVFKYKHIIIAIKWWKDWFLEVYLPKQDTKYVTDIKKDTDMWIYDLEWNNIFNFWHFETIKYLWNKMFKVKLYKSQNSKKVIIDKKPVCLIQGRDQWDVSTVIQNFFDTNKIDSTYSTYSTISKKVKWKKTKEQKQFIIEAWWNVIGKTKKWSMFVLWDLNRWIIEWGQDGLFIINFRVQNPPFSMG